MEERILNSFLEFTLWEVLGIAKKRFHDAIIDMMKMKCHLIKLEGPAKPMIVNMRATSVLEAEEDYLWRTTTQGHIEQGVF